MTCLLFNGEDVASLRCHRSLVAVTVEAELHALLAALNCVGDELEGIAAARMRRATAAAESPPQVSAL